MGRSQETAFKIPSNRRLRAQENKTSKLESKEREAISDRWTLNHIQVFLITQNELTDQNELILKKYMTRNKGILTRSSLRKNKTCI